MWIISCLELMQVFMNILIISYWVYCDLVIGNTRWIWLYSEYFFSFLLSTKALFKIYFNVSTAYGASHVLPMFVWVSSGFCQNKTHANRLIGCAKLPLGVNLCECVHGALQWPGLPSRVYSHLTPNVSGIGSRSIVTVMRITEVIQALL